jgi:hypothetical protein
MRKRKKEVPELCDVRKTQPTIASFEDGRGSGIQNSRQLLETGKDEKTDSAIEVPERKAAQ